MSDPARLIVDAFDFAAHAHANQVRGDIGDTYLVHLSEVASKCASVEPFDAILVAAAILHDTIEDTPVTEADLSAKFGPEITGIVMEVTDTPDVNPANKHTIQAERMKTASKRARLLKIADKTANTTALADLAIPNGYTPEQLDQYATGARAVVENCRGLNPGLETDFDAISARVDQLIVKLKKEASHDPR